MRWIQGSGSTGGGGAAAQRGGRGNTCSKTDTCMSAGAHTHTTRAHTHMLGRDNNRMAVRHTGRQADMGAHSVHNPYLLQFWVLGSVLGFRGFGVLLTPGLENNHKSRQADRQAGR